MRLALYQPDIPQNLGAAMRLAACLGTPLDIIDPCGFPLNDKALKRSAMDYGAHARITRHSTFSAFLAMLQQQESRLILLETDGKSTIYDFAFHPTDTLSLGRESAGSPTELRTAAATILRIPMAPGMRSMNVVMAGAIALSEALRQTGGMAKEGPTDATV